MDNLVEVPEGCVIGVREGDCFYIGSLKSYNSKANIVKLKNYVKSGWGSLDDAITNEEKSFDLFDVSVYSGVYLIDRIGEQTLSKVADLYGIKAEKEDMQIIKRLFKKAKTARKAEQKEYKAKQKEDNKKIKEQKYSEPLLARIKNKLSKIENPFKNYSRNDFKEDVKEVWEDMNELSEIILYGYFSAYAVNYVEADFWEEGKEGRDAAAATGLSMIMVGMPIGTTCSAISGSVFDGIPFVVPFFLPAITSALSGIPTGIRKGLDSRKKKLEDLADEAKIRTLVCPILYDDNVKSRIKG